MKNRSTLTVLTLTSLLLAPLTTLHAAETPASQPIDRETLDKWSAPYRGWHYQPDHVISAEPKIPGHEDFKNTDCPCVYPKQGGYEIDPGYEGVAASEDGMTWKRAKDKYILSVHEADEVRFLGLTPKGRMVDRISHSP